MNIIQTRNLTKSYGDFTAVSNLNLHVPKGSVYGFVGPNGAGKSTTMKMFLGLTRPSSGAFKRDRFFYRSPCFLRESDRRREPGYHPAHPATAEIQRG